MGIKIVRTPSETPNITNVDDIIPMRYAYGNQNGYVIGMGSELSGSYESGEFTVGSGRAVIQGVEVDIDANGVSTTLDTANETRYFKIYLKVNLANEVSELESYYSTVSYDEITEPTSGELISSEDAYLLLYTLKLNGTTQTEKNKVVNEIKYINTDIAVQKADFNNNNASQFGDYIVSKKKLLWRGKVWLNKNDTKITNLNLFNKNIEIVTESNSNKKFYKFNENSGYVGIDYLRGIWFFANGQIVVSGISFTVKSDGFYGRSWNSIYDIPLDRNTIEEGGGYVTEIYEIIE